MGYRCWKQVSDLLFLEHHVPCYVPCNTNVLKEVSYCSLGKTFSWSNIVRKWLLLHRQFWPWNFSEALMCLYILSLYLQKRSIICTVKCVFKGTLLTGQWYNNKCILGKFLLACILLLFNGSGAVLFFLCFFYPMLFMLYEKLMQNMKEIITLKFSHSLNFNYLLIGTYMVSMDKRYSKRFYH